MDKTITYVLTVIKDLSKIELKIINCKNEKNSSLS